MQQRNLQRFAIIMSILLLNPQKTVMQERAQVEVVPGPTSGIVIQEAPGLIMTERKIISQRIFINIDPELTIRRTLPDMKISNPDTLIWYEGHINRTRESARKILEQLKKTFIAKDEIPSRKRQGVSRQKRLAGIFVGLAALTVVGILVGSTVSAVNAVSIKKIHEHTQSLKGALKEIQEQIETQAQLTEEVIQVVNSTVILQNQQTLQMMHATHLLETFEQRYVDHLNLMDPINYATQEFLREFQDCISSLIKAQIPLYFITVQKVRQILQQVHHVEIEDLQIRVALEMGNAIPMFIDTEKLQLSFLMQIPLVVPENIYQTKRIYNVGTWKADTYMKIKAPDIVAFQNWTDGTLLVPTLETCLLFKDGNHLCPGKTFLPDSEGALCGLQKEAENEKLCDMFMSKPSYDELNTVVALIQDQWLVSTRATNMTVTYTLHGTFKIFPIQNRVSIIRVPRDVVVTIGDQTLFHIPNAVMEGKLELVHSFPAHEVKLDKDLEYLIAHKTDHMVQLAITEKEVKVRRPHFSMLDNQMIEQKAEVRKQWLIFLGVMLVLTVWLAVMSIVTIENARHRNRIDQVKKLKDAMEIVANATPML